MSAQIHVVVAATPPAYNGGMRTSRLMLLLLVFILMIFSPMIQAGNSLAQDQIQPAPSHRPQAESKKPKPAAEAEVRNTLASQVEAWNRGNIEGFMQGYWHSPELTFFSGATVTKGWEPTLLRYRQRYQGEGKQMGQLAFTELNVDLLGEHGAVVTGRWQLTTSDGKQPHGLFTLVLKQMQDGWKIVHDHTSAAE